MTLFSAKIVVFEDRLGWFNPIAVIFFSLFKILSLLTCIIFPCRFASCFSKQAQFSLFHSFTRSFKQSDVNLSCSLRFSSTCVTSLIVSSRSSSNCFSKSSLRVYIFIKLSASAFLISAKSLSYFLLKMSILAFTSIIRGCS